MRHVVMLSGGAASWYTGKVVKQSTQEPIDFLFADTLIEDDDLYRFLVEGVANILSLPVPAYLVKLYKTIPPLEKMEKRKKHLFFLCREAKAAFPGFHWVQEGRTPWEVFKDVRFLGNTRMAKCSHVLKQDACRSWLEKNCDPDDTRVYLGIHWSEMERFNGGEKGGAEALWLPWKALAPLCSRPFKPTTEPLLEMGRQGIAIPKLYRLGFSHNNCGGMCVRAGHGQFLKLLEEFPERYLYHEGQEEELREYLGKDVAILRDRTGGKVRPLPMREFRERAQGGCEFDRTDVGGCGCFSSERDS